MSLKHAILAILDISEGTGYDIARRFKQSVGCFWSATHQQIYKELKSLHEAGWVSYRDVTQNGKPAKIYRVTPEGQTALVDWLHQPSKPGIYKDPFLVRVYGAARLSPEALLAALDEQIEVHRQIQSQYLALDQLLHEMPEEKYERFRFPHATLKFGLKIESAWLEWANELKQDVQTRARKEANE